MGALADRLVCSMQDIRTFLQQGYDYSLAVLQIIADPVDGLQEDQVYTLAINGSTVTHTVTAVDTVDTVATSIETDINALGIVGLTVVRTASVLNISIATDTFSLVTNTNNFIIHPNMPDDFANWSMLEVAVCMADDYLNNDFAENDRCTGEIIAGTEQPIPKPVKTGVMQLFGFLLQQQLQGAASAGSSSSSGTPSGAIKKKKAGKLEVEFQTGKDAESGFVAEAAKNLGLPMMVQSILDMYRFSPGWRTPRKPLPRKFGLGDMNEGSELVPDSVINLNFTGCLC